MRTKLVFIATVAAAFTLVTMSCDDSVTPFVDADADSDGDSDADSDVDSNADTDRTGSLDLDEPAYLFVFDAEGQVSDGFSLEP